MKLTGAQALIKSLEMERRRGHVRPARRLHPARLRPDHRLADPPHPRPPRAGRRPHGRGLRPRHRPPGRGHGHQRPGGHQPRHAAVRRLHGLDPDGRDHRPGGPGRDRHRRLPGVRHGRHHPLGHQAQRADHGPGRHPPCRCARRSTSPPPAVPARCCSTCPRTCSRPTDGLVLAADADVDLPGYQPDDQGPPPHDQGGGPADRREPPPGHLRRRRHPQGPAAAEACGSWPS